MTGENIMEHCCIALQTVSFVDTGGNDHGLVPTSVGLCSTSQQHTHSHSCHGGGCCILHPVLSLNNARLLISVLTLSLSFQYSLSRISFAVAIFSVLQY